MLRVLNLLPKYGYQLKNGAADENKALWVSKGDEQRCLSDEKFWCE
jgi:hypothetical protein